MAHDADYIQARSDIYFEDNYWPNIYLYWPIPDFGQVPVGLHERSFGISTLEVRQFGTADLYERKFGTGTLRDKP